MQQQQQNSNYIWKPKNTWKFPSIFIFNMHDNILTNNYFVYSVFKIKNGRCRSLFISEIDLYAILWCNIDFFSFIISCSIAQLIKKKYNIWRLELKVIDA